MKYYKDNKGCSPCKDTCLDCNVADRCSKCPSVMTVDFSGDCSYLMTFWIILVVLGTLGICGCAIVLSMPKALQAIKDKSKTSSSLEHEDLAAGIGSTLIDGSDDEEDRTFGGSEGLGGSSEGGFGHAIAKPNAKSGKVAPGKFYTI